MTKKTAECIDFWETDCYNFKAALNGSSKKQETGPVPAAPDSEPVIKERGARALHAIIETGGKQYKVAEGDVLFIEKLPQQAGDAIKFDKVLAVLGDEPKFGAPLVEGATVDASVVKNGKGKKVVIFKYKPKKGYRLRQGHRQPYTKVEIKKINA